MRPSTLLLATLSIALVSVGVAAQSEPLSIDDVPLDDGPPEGYVGPSEDEIAMVGNPGDGVVVVISSTAVVRPGKATVTTKVGDATWTVGPRFVVGPHQTIVGAYQQVGNIDNGPDCFRINGGKTYGQGCGSFSASYEAALKKYGISVASSTAAAPTPAAMATQRSASPSSATLSRTYSSQSSSVSASAEAAAVSPTTTGTNSAAKISGGMLGSVMALVGAAALAL